MECTWRQSDGQTREETAWTIVCMWMPHHRDKWEKKQRKNWACPRRRVTKGWLKENSADQTQMNWFAPIMCFKRLNNANSVTWRFHSVKSCRPAPQPQVRPTAGHSGAYVVSTPWNMTKFPSAISLMRLHTKLLCKWRQSLMLMTRLHRHSYTPQWWRQVCFNQLTGRLRKLCSAEAAVNWDS